MSADPLASQAAGLRRKLCLMMFLQIFIWGAWFELGFDYIPALKFTGWQNALIFGAFNIGALVALLFSTQFADRKFAAEKFLGASHLIGGAAILGLFFLQVPVGTGVGEVSSARIIGRGPTITSGVAEGPNGATVVVENVVASGPGDKTDWSPEEKAKLAAYVAATPKEREDKKLGDGFGPATKFWAVFDRELQEYNAASDAERKDKKLKDPRFAVTFVVTENKPQTLAGDAKAPLAPFGLFFGLMLLHCVFYVPTVSITNSIAFANLKDPAHEFGPVRVWGTIGWIVASWPFIFILVNWAKVPALGEVGFVNWLGAVFGTSKEGLEASSAQRYIFLVSGLASFALAAISPTLPHTPPKPATGDDSFATLKAARLLKHPFVAVLFLVTFIDAAVHQSFFYWTASFLKTDVGIPANWVPPVMKIGQIAEILTMLVLGYVLKRLGWRATMVIGVLGHAARFAVFAFYPEPWAAVTVNIVHGICYAFFFATVYIFVDEFFPKDVRSSAQGLFNVLILGVGPFVANLICGQLGVIYKVGDQLQYSAIFQYSMAAGAVGAILLLLFFHPPSEAVKEPPVKTPEEKAPPVA
ncbi:MFS transporter [Gemmata sp. JC717]|uniref:MFS transporter n=1 Tax=Gemmata algarum TaxID=2975278 RepID=UPI0021BB0021|nr:MFS transporter [Gemmata algarum]MDY3551264.1 MFS transporter [Gemmata algarum]